MSSQNLWPEPDLPAISQVFLLWVGVFSGWVGSWVENHVGSLWGFFWGGSGQVPHDQVYSSPTFPLLFWLYVSKVVQQDVYLKEYKEKC